MQRNTKPDLEKIHSNPDYIESPRYKNSLNLYMEHNKKNMGNKTIGLLLGMSAEQIEEIYNNIVQKISKYLKTEAN